MYGERLRLLRQRAGLSREQLARRTQSVMVGAIRHYEQDRHEMRFSAAIELANALGVSLGCLAGLEPLPEGAGETAAAK